MWRSTTFSTSIRTVLVTNKRCNKCFVSICCVSLNSPSTPSLPYGLAIGFYEHTIDCRSCITQKLSFAMSKSSTSRKPLDPRIPQLITNGVISHTRSFFLIVGSSKQQHSQIVNLHYLQSHAQLYNHKHLHKFPSQQELQTVPTCC